jgi:hypothetical protein
LHISAQNRNPAPLPVRDELSFSSGHMTTSIEGMIGRLKMQEKMSNFKQR